MQTTPTEFKSAISVSSPAQACTLGSKRRERCVQVTAWRSTELKRIKKDVRFDDDESLAISSDLGMRPLMERVLSRRDILKA